MQSLEELNLSNNQIIDISPISSLSNLKSLKLSFNEIKGDVVALEKLQNLEILELDFNQIENIDALYGLTEMKELVLEGNRIQFIGAVENLENLSKLNLGNNGINDLQALGNLTMLEELYLFSNNISYFDPIDKMSRLRILDMSNNNIELFPDNNSPFIHITGLQELYLNNNSITDLLALEKLAYLRILHCSYNRIENIDSIKFLTNLRELFIEQNQIMFIEPITELPKLENVKLSQNPISDCPPDVWETNDIEQIRAHFQGQTRDASFRQAQQVQQKQVEELEQVQESLKQELEEKKQIIHQELEVEEQKNIKKEQEAIKQKLEKATKELEVTQKKQKELEDLGISDVKLIFVGNSGAGKTQLSKFFESGKLNKERESTHGIRLKRWLPTGTASPALASLNEKVAANIWDFGGQEYYHGTFRLFLSNYAVYILLWEKDTNRNEILSTNVHDGTPPEDLQHYQYRYWLDNIRHYAPTSPIIILQNKIDKDKKERVDTTWIKEYEIFGDHYISLHGAAEGKLQQYKWSFDLFCNDLAACMQNILADDANQQKSIAWLQVRDAVVDVVKGGKNKSKNPFNEYLTTGKFIKIEDFKKACLTIEPKLTESELYTLPRWLHNSGVVIYFSEHEELSDKVYFDPSWVTEGIYKILNETVRAKDGVFTKEDMKSRRGFRKDTVLALMAEMEIIFERKNES